MGMQKWRYIGTVTATIDHPETGPTVLTPQKEFSAPLVAVAHLQSIGRVVELKDKPKRVGPNRRPPRPLFKPRKPKPSEGDAELAVPVVASGLLDSATEKGIESRRPEKGKGKEKEKKPVKRNQESRG